MEKLQLVRANGNDYFLAHHADEIHFFRVNQTKELSLEHFMNASIHDNQFWKSGQRFDEGDMTDTYFDEESEVVAEVDATGFHILNEALWQERMAYYETK